MLEKQIELLQGDSAFLLTLLPSNSVDSIVTDPPYGLSFMGKKWDYDVPSTELWAECLRVLKPGGHLLAFAGTRTQHRMAVRIEDAGFEIRDMIAWVYGSGFPKSLDVSKAIDKAAGAVREVVGISTNSRDRSKHVVHAMNEIPNKPIDITAPATEAARQWQGWGTALKPALEPITVARKPLSEGTVAANVLAHGTGALNIDGCRVETDDNLNGGACSNGEKDLSKATSYATGVNAGDFVQPSGRWPANLIHDGSDEVLAGFPSNVEDKDNFKHSATSIFGSKGKAAEYNGNSKSSWGSAARFFYCSKASKRDRGTDNTHPTVKPTDLMAYLCRLVTPPGGVVLDPFMGSGSTGKAALLEGFQFIGIERDAEYFEIAKARIENAGKTD